MAERPALLRTRDVVARTQGEVDRAGSVHALARRWRCDRTLIQRALGGERTGPTVLRKLGLARATVYYRARGLKPRRLWGQG